MTCREPNYVELASALTALYLPGLPRIAQPTKRRWQSVVAVIARARRGQSQADALQRAGFDLESLLLSDSGLVDRARRLVEERGVLTAVCEGYPMRWLDRLGPAAPPVAWWNGIPFESSKLVAVVGSRSIDHQTEAWIDEVVWTLAAQGALIVSGSARGSDSTAVEAALRFHSDGNAPNGPAPVEVLPFGIRLGRQSPSAKLSVCSPDAPFRRETAMERNGLVYAMAEFAVVACIHEPKGGTWHGATSALRRKVCPIAIHSAPPSNAAAMLAALGAEPVQSVDDVVRFANSVLASSDGFYANRPARTAEGLVGERRLAYVA